MNADTRNAFAPVKAWWRSLAERERRLVVVAGAVVAIGVIWALLVQPAWRTIQRAPAEIERLDAQLQTMQTLAAEAQQLRAAPPVMADQAAAALQSATQRLGDKGKIVIQASGAQGGRATLTLTNVGSGALRDWLAEARAGARAKPLEARLTRAAAGYSGDLVVAFGAPIRDWREPPMKRWGLIGALVGGLLALAAFAPAGWLAGALASATEQRLLLADARGTLWRGSAVMVLTGGVDSRDASALPGRLHWTLGLDGAALGLRARHACCINDELRLRIVPGFGRLTVELLPSSGAGAVGQWPASWLSGLGTPWNTLQPSGSLQLASPGFKAQLVQGRWIFGGRLDLDMRGMASSLSTLDELGSYRVSLQGDNQGDSATVQLSTTAGALQINGSGQWVASKLRFNGQASAAPGSEAALSNLLNIIGRRRGPVSMISIG